MRRQGKRHPVLQTDETECGAACLATVCRYFGKEVPMQRLRLLAKVDRRGANLYGLQEAAQALGFNARGLEGSLEELRDPGVQKPCIAHVIIDGTL